MEKNQLAVRFTDQKYATKSEVAKELKMSLIDNIWDNICSYRSNFNIYLGIKNIENVPIKFCNCESISGKITQLTFKFLKFYKEISKFEIDKSDFKIFKNKAYSECANYLSKKYKIDTSTEYLRTIIMGEIKNIGNEYSPIINYINALDYIYEKSLNNIDVDFLANLYSKITNNEELVSFYRTNDDNNKENRVVVDRIYSSAPSKVIEPMMDNLFLFISNEKYSYILRALAAYYYFIYVKPFPSLNEELGILIFKGIICNYCSGGACAFIPFEKILIENQETISKIFFEVQKNNDITYFINYGLDFLNNLINQSLDEITTFNVSILKNDFYKNEQNVVLSSKETKQNECEKEDENNKKAFAHNLTKEKDDIFEAKTTKKVETIEENITLAKENKPSIVMNESKQTDRKVIEPVVFKESLAVNYIPPVLDENQAQRLEEHLLELDPTMKRGEAAFYARHCTLGKKYSIAQCKKFLSCAYETARKTMERLAELGYYRKEMVKNKFVYAPIQRK